MSRHEKLIRKFVYKQNEITISDVRSLLGDFGYTEWKKPGSECTFHKKENSPFNIPTVKGRYVKRRYAQIIVRQLKLEEYLEGFQKS